MILLQPRAAENSQVTQMGTEWGRREQAQHDRSRKHNTVLGNSEIMAWLVLYLCRSSFCGKIHFVCSTGRKWRETRLMSDVRRQPWPCNYSSALIKISFLILNSIWKSQQLQSCHGFKATHYAEGKWFIPEHQVAQVNYTMLLKKFKPKDLIFWCCDCSETLVRAFPVLCRFHASLDNWCNII